MSEQDETRKIIEDKLTGIHATMKAQNDINNAQHSEIMKEIREVKEKQNLTNGNVTKLQKETRVVRYLQKKPLLFLGVIFGIAWLANAVCFEEVINILSRLLWISCSLGS